MRIQLKRTVADEVKLCFLCPMRFFLSFSLQSTVFLSLNWWCPSGKTVNNVTGSVLRSVSKAVVVALLYWTISLAGVSLLQHVLSCMIHSIFVSNSNTVGWQTACRMLFVYSIGGGVLQIVNAVQFFYFASSYYSTLEVTLSHLHQFPFYAKVVKRLYYLDISSN